MSVNGIPLLPIVQMGHVEKVVEEIQNSPQLQQYAAQDSAQKALDAAKAQVQRTQASAGSRGVDPDEEQSPRQQQPHQQPAKQHEGNDPEAETTSQSANPWVGIIINKTV